MQIMQNQYAQNNYQGNSFEDDDDDIVIPTVNSNYDYDMIADDAIGEEEEGIGADDDNIMSDSYRNSHSYDQDDYSDPDPNLSRLPGHIQIERLVEHNAWN